MKRLTWSILLLLPCALFAQDVFVSVDDNGVVTYSDRPTDNAERIRVNTFAGAPAANAAQTRGETDEGAADSQVLAEMPREATPEEIAEDRARNCTIARERADAYSISHRLFRTTADGEREYLSDDEISEARAKAEADVASWCD